jgi:hypothetical protein
MYAAQQQAQQGANSQQPTANDQNANGSNNGPTAEDVDFEEVK